MNAIKVLRTSIPMNGDEFGKLIGVTRSAISKYERGKISASKKKKHMIADIFKIDVSLLKNDISETEIVILVEAAKNFANTHNNKPIIIVNKLSEGRSIAMLSSMYIRDTANDGQLFCGCRREDCNNYKTEECHKCLRKHIEEEINNRISAI